MALSDSTSPLSDSVGCNTRIRHRQRGRQNGERYIRGPRKPASDKSLLMPLMQGADESGIPYTTLRKLHHQGELPIVKLGSAWFIKRRDLHEFIERHTERASA